MSSYMTDSDYQQVLDRSEQEWIERGEQNALALFHKMAERVPAYKDFLQKNGVNPQAVQTIVDFQRLPIITKDNYLRAYPLEQLCWDGTQDGLHQFSCSSGSTGEPYYWPSSDVSEQMARWNFAFILRHNFGVTPEKRTLIVNCFALGTWVAGTLCNDVLWDFAKSDSGITLISPGINKVEAIRGIQKLAHMYDQVVMLGYGPFAKDVVEEGALQGIDWKGLNFGLLSGGEAYNETWRDYLAELLGIDRSRIVNMYASIDNGGPTATESDLTRGLRQVFMHNPAESKKAYGQERQPSLVQYNPEIYYAEAVNNELVFTRDHAIPLVRYNIGDNGGVMSFNVAKELFEQTGGTLRPGQLQMPLLYIFGRSHHTATIYGLNLYPENVRAGAEDVRIRQHLSGKALTVTGYSSNMDQQLEITLELAPGAEVPNAELAATMQQVFVERMTEQNSEYRELTRQLGERVYPLLTFVPYGDPQFMVASKQTRQTLVKAK